MCGRVLSSAAVNTLRARMAQRDAESFVGREAEVAWFEQALRGEVPERIVHIVGEPGIGKSALIRQVERQAQHDGRSTVWIDGREVTPFPQQIEEMVAEIDEEQPALIVLDSYELISSLDAFLRDVVIPELPASTLVVIASRVSPSRSWFEHGWDSLVKVVQLPPLTADEVERLAAAHGVPADAAHEVVRQSNGSPLAVVVGTGRGPALTELADRLIGAEVDPSRSRVLSVAAIARVTTPEMLADVLDDADPHDSFKWLSSRSFADPLAVGVALHALVAEALRARLAERDPAGEAMLRRRIANHLYRRALAGHRGISTELQHLVRDPTARWGFADDFGSRYRIDQVRPGDADQIGAILDAVGAGEWWSFTRVFVEQYPEYCGVARIPDGTIGGYFVAVSPGSAPPPAEADPALGPWLRYAREVLRTRSAVLWRDAVDLTGGNDGEVTSLLGAGGLLSTGVANPRYCFLPISPKVPAAREFSELLGADHVPELDLHAHGEDLECHIVDLGARGLLGFQRDWIYRETGASPPDDPPDVDPVEVIKFLRDPERLVAGPEFLGLSPSARLERLRELVTDALAVFGDGHDDRVARAIITEAYLADNAPHDTIARRLHLSRSAYFRRLHAASQRVSEELAVLLRHDR